MSRQFKEEQIAFIQRIKNLMNTPSTEPKLFMPVVEKPDVHSDSVPPQEDVENKIENNEFNLRELFERIEKIENLLEADNQYQDKDGIRKNKVKEQIISLLKQNKKLNSVQMSKLIGLSRTRCNEYFRELTKEGLTEGVIIDRQKFYKLVKE